MKNDKKVMIVDDEMIFAMDMKMTLERLGYTVPKPESRGVQAVERIRTEEPNCIFLDVRLAGPIDGLEVARRVRAFSTVPIIFITGYEDTEIESKIRAIPSTDVLYKPFPTENIEQKLRELLS